MPVPISQHDTNVALSAHNTELQEELIDEEVETSHPVRKRPRVRGRQSYSEAVFPRKKYASIPKPHHHPPQPPP